MLDWHHVPDIVKILPGSWLRKPPSAPQCEGGCGKCCVLLYKAWQSRISSVINAEHLRTKQNKVADRDFSLVDLRSLEWNHTGTSDLSSIYTGKLIKDSLPTKLTLSQYNIILNYLGKKLHMKIYLPLHWIYLLKNSTFTCGWINYMIFFSFLLKFLVSEIINCSFEIQSKKQELAIMLDYACLF